jgi:hypothetical protein
MRLIVCLIPGAGFARRRVKLLQIGVDQQMSLRTLYRTTQTMAAALDE